MPQEQTTLREHTGQRTAGPPMYNVIIYNDDYTPMEFVVQILTDVFFKSHDEAVALMLTVHHAEQAVVGTYVYDIASSKVKKATRMAREKGHPLRLNCQKA